MQSRRDFAKVALAGLPLARAWAKLSSVVNGVHLGVQTYSFREFKGDDVIGQIIKAMTDIGLSECEFFGPQADHAAGGHEKMTEAERLAIPLDKYAAIGKRFSDAGIQIYGYNGSFGSSEALNNRTFDIAKAMGAKIVTWSGTISVARQIAPLVDQHKVIVACHGHSNTKDPNQFATPESFATVMSLSKYFWVNLDIGHFTAAGYDPLDYIKQHHDRITNIHLKDRKKNDGDNVPWGEGDTPIKPVLQLLKRNKYPIRAYIEYEYKGAEGPEAEVKKCFEYAKAALA